MDDKSNELLSQILAAQKEQNDLLRKNLWRVKFSLFALMLLMTVSAIGLGVGVYLTRPKATPVTPLVTAPAAPADSGGMPMLRRIYANPNVPSVPADNPFGE